MYINDELIDAETYRTLAKSTNNEETAAVLNAIANDEDEHADMFSKLYKMMTGYTFQPDPVRLPPMLPLKAALKKRIGEETAASKKYRNEALENQDKFRLRNAFIKAAHDEALHAILILSLDR